MEQENEFEKGDVIAIEHDGEELTLRLETQNMADFLNSTIEFEKEWSKDLVEIVRRKKSLNAMNEAIVWAAQEQAIVDSIVQHCLTGK